MDISIEWSKFATSTLNVRVILLQEKSLISWIQKMGKNTDFAENPYRFCANLKDSIFYHLTWRLRRLCENVFFYVSFFRFFFGFCFRRFRCSWALIIQFCKKNSKIVWNLIVTSYVLFSADYKNAIRFHVQFSSKKEYFWVKK